MMGKHEEHPVFSKQIPFSDEVTFFLDRFVNRQNMRYWSDTNLQYAIPSKSKRLDRTSKHRVVVPYFYIQNLTGQLYLKFLQNWLILDLINLFPLDNNRKQLKTVKWFQ